MHYQCSCTTLLQRCAVEHCSKHGPFVLTTSDELSAAKLNIRFKPKCRGHHLCDKHRAQIPGRQRQAGVDAVEAAAEREKTEASTAAAAARDDQMYARGYQDGYMAADERKRDARRSPSVIATLSFLRCCSQAFHSARLNFSLTLLASPFLARSKRFMLRSLAFARK